MALASVGTDTGGSIRIPAAACGVVGLKPTFGELSCDGVVPLAPTLDHVGPLGLTVDDVATVYRALAAEAQPAAAAGSGDDGGLPAAVRIGLPRRYFLDLLDPDGARRVRGGRRAPAGRRRGVGRGRHPARAGDIPDLPAHPVA